MSGRRLLEMLTKTTWREGDPTGNAVGRESSRHLNKAAMMQAAWDLGVAATDSLIAEQLADLAAMLARELLAADLTRCPAAFLPGRHGRRPELYARWAALPWTHPAHITFDFFERIAARVPSVPHREPVLIVVMAAATWDLLVESESDRTRQRRAVDPSVYAPAYHGHPVAFLDLPPGVVFVLYREPDPERDADGKLPDGWVDRSTATVVEVEGLAMTVADDPTPDTTGMDFHLTLRSMFGVKINPATGFRFDNVLGGPEAGIAPIDEVA